MTIVLLGTSKYLNSELKWLTVWKLTLIEIINCDIDIKTGPISTAASNTECLTPQISLE